MSSHSQIATLPRSSGAGLSPPASPHLPANPAGARPHLRIVHAGEAEHTDGPHPAISPSLHRGVVGAAPAFEIKFLVEEETARAIEAFLAPHMSPDPHSLIGPGPGAESGYRISSLYCDTAEQFVYQQRGRFKRYKLRARRYGAGDTIFLERKSKKQQRVKKRRTEVAPTDLPRLLETAIAEDWNAAWFHARALNDGLRPVCRVDYSRVAYFAQSTEGPLRLTFDRQIRGMAVQGWDFAPAGPEHALLCGQVICEFKFRGSLPALFKSAIAELALSPRGVSKFRQTMGRLIEALELPAPHAGEGLIRNA